jgi:NAD(P)-dependent dehydrogenase (short-subunit alcohol dehydrogenase family)
MSTPTYLAGRFADRVAAVTGGGGAIGSSTARRLAAEGASVLVVDFDGDAAQATVDSITAEGGTAVRYVADVADPAQVKGYVDETVAQFGRIDILFNNAAINGTMVPFVEYTPEVWQKVMAVNVNGVFYGLHYALPHMLEQGKGNIVNTASVAGITGHAEHGAYGASKHAVVGITRIAAAEVAGKGVRVNTLAPGPVNAPMMHATEKMQTPDDPMRYRAKVLANIPAGRYAEISEIASAACWLMSDDSEYVHGIVLPVEGAFTSSH